MNKYKKSWISTNMHNNVRGIMRIEGFFLFFKNNHKSNIPHNTTCKGIPLKLYALKIIIEAKNNSMPPAFLKFR